MSAAGTTTLARAQSCTASATESSSALLKSRMAALAPGFSTRSRSPSVAGMSLTFRSPYPIVAASNEQSSNGIAIASPCTQLMLLDLRGVGGSLLCRLAASSSMFCAKSSPTTLPPDPTASASKNAMSPLPQQISRAVPPARAPAHFTAIRFHMWCCPRLSKLFSWSYTGAISLNSFCRASPLVPSSNAPVGPGLEVPARTAE
mmetsp:Transcript_24500/g.43607  ORF Transcript_24500/g.43607 Transcript_24500/m.43607 type:complete len:203 (-) Transcript_24500:204-812(-)